MPFWTVFDGKFYKVPDREKERHGTKEIPEPPEDAQIRGGSVKYKWDSNNESFVEVAVPPTPEEAKDKVEQLLVDAYTGDGSDTPKMDANEMLDNYPSVYRHLDNGGYQFAVDYIRAKIEPNESIVTTAMVDEYEQFLQVNN